MSLIPTTNSAQPPPDLFWNTFSSTDADQDLPSDLCGNVDLSDAKVSLKEMTGVDACDQTICRLAVSLLFAAIPQEAQSAIIGRERLKQDLDAIEMPDEAREKILGRFSAYLGDAQWK